MSGGSVIRYCELNAGNFSCALEVPPLVLSVQKVHSKPMFGCCLCGREFDLMQVFSFSFQNISTHNNKSVKKSKLSL
jgi:hypothetical protein